MSDQKGIEETDHQPHAKGKGKVKGKASQKTHTHKPRTVQQATKHLRIKHPSQWLTGLLPLHLPEFLRANKRLTCAVFTHVCFHVYAMRPELT
jgi:hypothetical protein